MLLESEVDLALSHERALSFLDSNFISLDASGDSLPDISAEIAAQHATLQREVRCNLNSLLLGNLMDAIVS